MSRQASCTGEDKRRGIALSTQLHRAGDTFIMVTHDEEMAGRRTTTSTRLDLQPCSHYCRGAGQASPTHATDFAGDTIRFLR
jgi:hypothetical protein